MKKKHYFLVGIGGISMSGIAKVLRAQGHEVSGSDAKDSKVIDELKKLGIDIYIGHSGEKLKIKNQKLKIDEVVYSLAVPADNPELVEAKRLGIPIKRRSEIIGELMKNKIGLAVAGMHGKTTTSAMISLILENAGLAPTILIGGEVKRIGGNCKIGKGKYFVAEACEYKEAFLDFKPKIAVITNIEPEHLDYYKNLNNIIKSFSKFINLLPKDGLAVIWGDDENIQKLKIKNQKLKILTYGFGKQNDYRIINLKQIKGKMNFNIISPLSQTVDRFSLKIPGKHNVLNAAAAIVVADYLGINRDITKKVLAEFVGVDRRCEVKGKYKGVIIIDDYAHHPTEIRSTLEGLRKFYQPKRLICVFQPHQHHRTKILLKDFGHSFNQADLVIMPEIYGVIGREEEKGSISSKDVVAEVKKNGGRALFIESFEKIIDYLKKELNKGDLLVTMGAGEAYKIGEGLLCLK